MRVRTSRLRVITGAGTILFGFGLALARHAPVIGAIVAAVGALMAGVVAGWEIRDEQDRRQ